MTRKQTHVNCLFYPPHFDNVLLHVLIVYVAFLYASYYSTPLLF